MSHRVLFCECVTAVFKGRPPKVGALGIIRIHRYESEYTSKHRIDPLRSVMWKWNVALMVGNEKTVAFLAVLIEKKSLHCSADMKKIIIYPLKIFIQIRSGLSYQLTRGSWVLMPKRTILMSLSHIFPSGQGLQAAHVQWKAWLSSTATSNKTFMIHMSSLPAYKTHHTQCIVKSSSF